MATLFRVQDLSLFFFLIFLCLNMSFFVCAQSCPTLCDLMDCSPSDSSFHGILQAILLQQVAIPYSREFPGGSNGKESASNEGDLGLIPGLGRSPGGGHGNPLLYSFLENPHGRGAWQPTVHEAAESDKTERLSTAHSRASS